MSTKKRMKKPTGDQQKRFCRTCNFYLKRKKRFCQMLTRPGLNYCGQHLVEEPSKEGQRKRIPCPLDPKHSCYEDQLELHMLKCNAREVTGIPYVKQNINLRCSIQEEPPRTPLSALTDEKLLQFIAKVEAVHKEHIGTIEDSVLSHSVFEEEMKTPGYGISVIRHLGQNSSLLGHLECSGLLDTNTEPTCYVEFGAGRGQLTHWLTEAVTNTDKALFVLVDRGSQRYKFDAKLKYREELALQRLRVDIKNLDLLNVEGIKSYNRVIAVGKHLCGGATDLTLLCMTKLQERRASGVVLALCCHHRCTWTSYTGSKFLQECGFNPEEFYTLTALTSWATCSSRDVKSENAIDLEEKSKIKSSEDVDKKNANELKENAEKDLNEIEKNEKSEEHKPPLENRYTRMGLSALHREEVGRKAKQIIDFGRVKYMQDCGFSCRLVQYVTKEMTLENIALIAKLEH